MKVQFITDDGERTYAPPSATKVMADNTHFVWCRTDDGEIKPAFDR